MEKASKKFGNNNKDYIERHWKRFLDDCFIRWDLNIAPPEEFHHLLNQLHPQIKFAKEWSYTKINFLDVSVIKEKNGNISADIFYKATDFFNYVPFQSGHPHHTKANIPVNLAQRLKTVVSKDKKLPERMEELNYLEYKSYPPNLITDAIKRAKELPRTELRKTKEKAPNKNILAFVTTYTPYNPNVFPTIKNTLPLLKQR